METTCRFPTTTVCTSCLAFNDLRRKIHRKHRTPRIRTRRSLRAKRPLHLRPHVFSGEVETLISRYGLKATRMPSGYLARIPHMRPSDNGASYIISTASQKSWEPIADSTAAWLFSALECHVGVGSCNMSRARSCSEVSPCNWNSKQRQIWSWVQLRFSRRLKQKLSTTSHFSM